MCLYISQWWLVIDVMLSAMESTSACNIPKWQGNVRFLDIAGIFLCICDLDTVWNRCWTDINSQSPVTWLILEAGACLADVCVLTFRRSTSRAVIWKPVGQVLEDRRLSRGGEDGGRSRELMQQFLFYITSFFVHNFLNKVYIAVLQLLVKLRHHSGTNLTET